MIEPASRGFSIGGDNGGSRGVAHLSRGWSQCAQARVPLGERRVALEGEGRARRETTAFEKGLCFTFRYGLSMAKPSAPGSLDEAATRKIPQGAHRRQPGPRLPEERRPFQPRRHIEDGRPSTVASRREIERACREQGRRLDTSQLVRARASGRRDRESGKYVTGPRRI